MDSRYQFVQHALDGTSLGLHSWAGWSMIFGLVIVAKCLATGAMVGADTAGGLFGPVVFIGGVAGALTGAFFTTFFPGTFPEDLRESLIAVGMAGVLSASLRTPLAAIVMVMEMTGSYGLIVPLMLVSVVSYLAGRRWGVYPEQVGGPMESPAHAGETMVTVLENARVQDLTKVVWPFVAQPGTSLPQLLAMLPEGARPETPWSRTSDWWASSRPPTFRA
jgi:CIC family chloride channel protein